MPVHTLETGCCIVGGGPAGLMLGLLLARDGIDVVVLEKHRDFLRDFRGDTIHASTLDLVDALGLRDRFDALPQTTVTRLDAVINGNRLTPVDFTHLRGRNRSIVLMPQWDFLTLLAEAAAEYPNFRLVPGADAVGVLREGDRVAGVTAVTADGPLDVRAALTVAADGRASVVRAAAGLPTRDYGVPVDVLWFRLPLPVPRPPDTLAYLAADSFVVTIPRTDYYQSGLLIRKGSEPEIRAAGLEALRTRIVRAAPVLADSVLSLRSFDQVRLLTVQVNRLKRWWLPGLLCIGDAAHAMSPAFGVGINYAVQDAVAAARILAEPLRTGSVPAQALARVQRRRLPAVRLMQPIQLLVHRVIAKPGGGAVLHQPPSRAERVVLAVLLPVLRRLSARLIGRGFRPERLAASAGRRRTAGIPDATRLPIP